MKNTGTSLPKGLTRFLLAPALALTVGMLACQPGGQVGTPVAEKKVEAGQAATSSDAEGAIAAKFDLGESLNPADFSAVVSPAPGPVGAQPPAFRILQASGANFSLQDIAKATVTLTSTQVETPATVTLTRNDIANGWSFVFRGIPTGNATISLQIFNISGKEIFKDSKNAEVVAGLTTPVDFVLELGGSPGGSCVGTQCTGSVKVSVKAVTKCLGRVSLLPTVAKVSEAVTVNVADLQGDVQQYGVALGDGTPSRSVNSMPLKHTYTKPGRYKVTMTLSGQGCKNPYSVDAYISVEK